MASTVWSLAVCLIASIALSRDAEAAQTHVVRYHDPPSADTCTFGLHDTIAPNQPAVQPAISEATQAWTGGQGRTVTMTDPRQGTPGETQTKAILAWCTGPGGSSSVARLNFSVEVPHDAPQPPTTISVTVTDDQGREWTVTIEEQ